MDLVADIRASLGDDWLPQIYKQKVRSGRTRSLSIDIPHRSNSATIEYTLLGIELKVGKRRFACPDLATARYMRVFARIGCSEFAIPYDITRISGIADEMETSWQRTLLFIQENVGVEPAGTVTHWLARIVRTIRDEIDKMGPGDVMPLFDRETRQRE